MTDNQEPSFSQCYRILGISPDGLTWNQVKTAYRKSSQKWHPDRAEQNLIEVSVANEKFRIINTAYKTIKSYYDKYGVLPDIRPAINLDNETTGQDSVQPPPVYNTQSTNKSHKFTFAGIFLALVAIGYMLYPQEDNDTVNGSVSQSQPIKYPQAVIEKKYPVRTDSKKYQTKVFTYGSSMGDVVEAQGAPSRIEDNIWWYGQSKVMFSNGEVVDWKTDEMHPLNVTLESDIEHAALTDSAAKYEEISHASKPQRNKKIAIGASKQDVLLIQGKPMQALDDVWVYGVSKIYFRGGKVSSWYNSPFDPLNVED